MAKTLIFRNAPSTGIASVVGTLAELFVDTTLKTVVVMDGVNSGGTTLARNTDLTSLSSNVNTRLTNVTSQTIATTSLTIGSSVATLWNFVQSSNGSLYLYFNGVAKFRFDTGGTITATNDLIAVGTI